ncbi:MAG: terminase family protein [Alphaproteobacteria bacterium]|jgi:predicted phage terminase large subunit-like protein|nr:terminase family protein [Alphaproteobacteria bacterium]
MQDTFEEYYREAKVVDRDLQNKKKRYSWIRQARPSQLPPPGDWRTWLILAGRGFGKTRTGAETLRQWVHDGRCRRIALLSKTIGDARDVMVDGISGLLEIHPLSERPWFEQGRHQLIWPNGTLATLYGADHFECLRGPQFDAAWIDELAKFRHPEEAWNQLMLGLRLGTDPRCIVTTTPRPIPLIEKLLKSEDVVVTKGTTFENRDNLAPTFLKQIVKQFEGTRLGAQELYAQLLTEQQGALWRRDLICYQEPPYDEAGTPKLIRIIVAIDPATTHHEDSDETGIVIAGLSEDKHAYVLEDLSGRLSPGDWGQRVCEVYWRMKADRVVAEVNKGGDLVERILRGLDPTIPYKAVRATRGKFTRAEPIAALYEQHRVFHARPFDLLETQLCTYVQGITHKSPDRLDALVWALTDLLLESETNPTLKLWTTT